MKPCAWLKPTHVLQGEGHCSCHYGSCLLFPWVSSSIFSVLVLIYATFLCNFSLQWTNSLFCVSPFSQRCFIKLSSQERIPKLSLLEIEHLLWPVFFGATWGYSGIGLKARHIGFCRSKQFPPKNITMISPKLPTVVSLSKSLTQCCHAWKRFSVTSWFLCSGHFFFIFLNLKMSVL